MLRAVTGSQLASAVPTISSEAVLRYHLPEFRVAQRDGVLHVHAIHAI